MNGNFIENYVRKNKALKMKSLMMKNRKGFGEVFKISQQNIRTMQDGKKTSEVRFMSGSKRKGLTIESLGRFLVEYNNQKLPRPDLV